MNDSVDWNKGAGVRRFFLPLGTDRMDRQSGSHSGDGDDDLQERTDGIIG